MAADPAASDPLLRRIRTAEILCYHLNDAGYDMHSAKENSEAAAESAKWLSAVEKMGVEHVGEAERLAWMAYCVGNYNQAEGWLKRADPETGLALWLRAKLLFVLLVTWGCCSWPAATLNRRFMPFSKATIGRMPPTSPNGF